MQKNNFSGTQPNIEQENVAQSENLTSPAQSVQAAENVQESALQRLEAAIAQGNNAVNNAVVISKEKSTPVQGIPSTSESTKADWRKFLPRSLANPVPDNPLFLHGESIVMIRGTLVALKGRAKVGKSQFYGYLTAALLKDGQPVGDGGLRAACAGLKVLIIDTEMTEEQGVTKVKRGFNTAGVPVPDAPYSDRLNILFVKSRPPKDIIAITEAAIADLQPDLIIIDGVVQLFPSFNDEEEANAAMNWLKGLTLGESKPCVIAVLHTNLSDKDTSAGAKMRGHLGTQLELSADTIISVSKKDRIFTAEIPDGRRPEDCKISWTIDNEHGMYLPTTETQAQGVDKKLSAIFEDIHACMIQLALAGEKTNKKNIVDLYTKNTPYKDSSAYDHIVKCAKAGLIVFDPLTSTYSTPPSKEELISKEK